MNPKTRELLDAIRKLADEARDAPPMVLSQQYLQDLDAIMALPQNQSGVHRSSFWPQYEACRRHFARAKLA